MHRVSPADPFTYVMHFVVQGERSTFPVMIQLNRSTGKTYEKMVAGGDLRPSILVVMECTAIALDHLRPGEPPEHTVPDGGE